MQLRLDIVVRVCIRGRVAIGVCACRRQQRGKLHEGYDLVRNAFISGRQNSQLNFAVDNFAAVVFRVFDASGSLIVHSTPEPQNEMQNALLLYIVLCEGTIFFHQPSNKNEPHQVWRYSLLILNEHLHVKHHAARIHPQCQRFSVSVFTKISISVSPGRGSRLRGVYVPLGVTGLEAWCATRSSCFRRCAASPDSSFRMSSKASTMYMERAGVWASSSKRSNESARARSTPSGYFSGVRGTATKVRDG